MNDPVALEEVKISISKLNMGMAVRKDGIFDGDHLADTMHRIILNLRNAGNIPKDWRDVILIPLYESKHMNEFCMHCHGIILFSLAVKILVESLLSLLNAHIRYMIWLELQCNLGLRGN